MYDVPLIVPTIFISDIWVVGTSNLLFLTGSKTGTNFPKKQSSYWKNSTLCDKSILQLPFYLSSNWLLIEQFWMEMMYFQSQRFQLKNGTPVFSKKFPFFRKFLSKLKYWKRLKLSLIVTWKHADLSNGGLFWKSLVPFFRRTYALSVGFKQPFQMLRQKPTQVLP